LLLAAVAPADRHDTHLGAMVLRVSRRLWPFLARCWTDAGFAGPRVAHATPVRIAVVGARSRTQGFTVQERRWVIERTFGIFGHNRRLARDHEGRPDVAAGWITLASAAQMLRRLARA
jgi:transposase